MSEEKKVVPSHKDKGTTIEKGVRVEESFNKIPDFKFTPPPPPPPEKKDSQGSTEAK